MSLPAVDPVQEWAAARGRVVELVRGADSSELAQVQACSDWTALELVRHMVGVGDDVRAGEEPDDHHPA